MCVFMFRSSVTLEKLAEVEAAIEKAFSKIPRRTTGRPPWEGDR